MRKLTIVTTLFIALLSGAGTIVFAAHGEEPAVDGMATMEGMAGTEGMAGMEGMVAGDGAMPMKGMSMMPMMMGMMENMPMMGMMGMMGMMAMMPTGGQPDGGMAGMDTMAPAPAAVPAGLDAKLDLLIKSIDSLTARIEKLEAPAGN